MAEIDGVRESHSVGGSDADIVVIVTVPEYEDVATVVTEHISRVPGVRSTTTLFAFRSFSQADAATRSATSADRRVWTRRTVSR